VTSPGAEAAFLARELVALRRRLEVLERSAQLGRSSVTGEDGTTVNAAAGILAGSRASTDAALALAGLSDVQSTTDGKMTVFYSDTAPTEADDNPEFGDQWLVADNPATYLGATYPVGTLLRYDGDTWILAAQSAAAALAAAQSAQTTADGKIETYWQGTAPPTGSEGDLWYETADLEPGELVPKILSIRRFSGGVWAPLPLTSSAIAQAGLDPDRLAVGVTGNLIQDPQLVTNLRTPPTYWSIIPAEEGAPVAGARMIRATGTTDSHPAETGSSSMDTTWAITDLIPVEAGRVVRFAAQVRVSAEVLAQVIPNTYVRLRLRFSNSTGDAVSSGVHLAQIIPSNEGVVAGAWNPLEVRVTVPDGYTAVQALTQTTYHRAGTVDYIGPELQVLWDRVQSSDYAEGNAGWALNGETVQLPNANILGAIGADTISAAAVSLGGLDLETEYLSPLPLGIIAYDISSSGYGTGNALTTGTQYKVYEFAMGPSGAGRLYRIVVDGHLQSTDPGDVFDIRINYTTDGSTPTASSPLMRSKRIQMGASSAVSTGFSVEKIFSTAGSYANVRFAITLARAAGTGLGYIYGAGSDRALVVYVEDVGLYGAAADAGTLSQKSFATVGGTTPPAQPDPVNTYTKTWAATWGRSYDQDNGTRNGDDTADLYQGYISSTHGNTKSLFGFDYASIQSALSGATVKSVRLQYRVKHAWGGAGISVRVSSHNYTSKPSSWSSGNVNTERAAFGSQKEGATYTQILPVAIGNEFKAGTTRGLGFGPGPSTSASAYYGYMYSGPKLTITYTK